MNVLKHMEAIFLSLLVTAGVASIAIDRIPPAQAQPVQQAKAAARDMPVVYVTAKRPRHA